MNSVNYIKDISLTFFIYCSKMVENCSLKKRSLQINADWSRSRLAAASWYAY